MELTLDRTLRYELLGANNQDATMSANKLSIPRIGPADEVTVLLLVENGVFTKDGIVQCLSKETKGKVVSKLEEVAPTGMQRVGLVAGLIVVPLVFYVSTLGIEYLIKVPKAPKVADATGQAELRREKPAAPPDGWKMPAYYKTTSTGLYTDFMTGKLGASVGVPTRKGDVVSLPVLVRNGVSGVVKYTIKVTSVLSEKRIAAYDRQSGDIVLAPGKIEERALKVIVPERGGDPAERLVFVELFFQTFDGDSLKVMKEIQM